MLNYLNNFLNKFEIFVKKVTVSLIGLFLLPLLILAYIFGFLDFKIDDDE